MDKAQCSQPLRTKILMRSIGIGSERKSSDDLSPLHTESNEVIYTNEMNQNVSSSNKINQSISSNKSIFKLSSINDNNNSFELNNERQRINDSPNKKSKNISNVQPYMYPNINQQLYAINNESMYRFLHLEPLNFYTKKKFINKNYGSMKLIKNSSLPLLKVQDQIEQPSQVYQTIETDVNSPKKKQSIMENEKSKEVKDNRGKESKDKEIKNKDDPDYINEGYLYQLLNPYHKKSIEFFKQSQRNEIKKRGVYYDKLVKPHRDKFTVDLEKIKANPRNYIIKDYKEKIGSHLPNINEYHNRKIFIRKVCNEFEKFENRKKDINKFLKNQKKMINLEKKEKSMMDSKDEDVMSSEKYLELKRFSEFASRKAPKIKMTTTHLRDFKIIHSLNKIDFDKEYLVEFKRKVNFT